MSGLDPAGDTLPPIVLLVENDSDTREMYEAALSVDGLWTAHASEGLDAFAYAVELRPDAVVTEVGLAGTMDGVSLARRLKAEPKTAQIPILAVTGAQPLANADVFESVLVKPVAPPLLVERLRRAIDRSRDLRQRSIAAVQPVPDLLDKTTGTLARSTAVRAENIATMPPQRRCPRCGGPLNWVEQRELASVSFDYFRPCPEGCGLFCFDRSQQCWIALFE